MASNGESSSTPPQSTTDKPVIVRVKRKASQFRLDAFWLEINERPLKRPFSDFEKLSISESSQREELKSKKVFVRHVDTLTSSQATVDIVQSFIPNSADVTEGNTKSQEGRRPQKTNYRQEQLSKSIQKQEEIAKNARFEQIWRSRRGKKEAVDEMYHFYDVVRVEVEEKSNNMQIEEESLEDRELLSSYLPLLREFIPAAAAEIEADVRAYMFEKDADGYVYDYYTVKNDLGVGEEDMASNPFPLVKVDDEDFYDVPYESEYDSEDSNAEDNPRNDYPDETSEEEEEEEEEEGDEDEDEETKASDQSGEGSSKSSEVGSVSGYDEDLLYEVDPYDDINGDSNHLGHGNSDYDTDGEEWRWSYR
ncbi:hypothetical protein ES288_A03G037300v1 [Gossypium darwinii]|uniref:Transcription factor Iwr1 domain-containing protein n=1 Tax=Gossypium darwinii TaxID=34276 RepID=A0A5D2H025_GOSDA|nr:hypothetical protein ES288_A03G037300v1 [Gossypium darwinii]